MIYSFHIHLFIGFMQIDTALFRRGSFLWGVVVLTAVLFASCNDDVFVENITPEVTKLQMPADGSTRSIGFQSGDWELWGMSFVNNPLYFDLLRGNIYDLQGQLLAADTVLCGGGWWKWELEHSTLALTVERPSAKELRVTAEENITSSPVSLNLFVGNERDTYTICLDIAPTAEPYRLDSIVYSTGHWLQQDSLEVQGEAFALINPVDHVSVFEVYPYRKSAYEVNFTCEELPGLSFLGEKPPLAPLIDTGQYGIPAIADGQLPYTLTVQRFALPLALQGQKEEVEVEANETVNGKVRLWYAYYGFPYRAYAIHPLTGRRRVLTGLLEFRWPVGYEILFE